MKPRVLVSVLSVGVMIATVAMVGRQRQQLGKLQNQAQQLQARVKRLTNEAPAEAETSITATTPAGPSLELLRLRSQVGQLERRKRELAGAAEENKRLQTQLASKSTNRTSGVTLPAGYIRRAEAKQVGFGSPENSLQTFLWAIEHRDLPTVLQFFGPEQAKQMAAEVEQRGATEEFWNEARSVPGLQVIRREPKEDGAIVLTVQIAPNDESSAQQMPFKQIDGQWRLVSGF